MENYATFLAIVGAVTLSYLFVYKLLPILEGERK